MLTVAVGIPRAGSGWHYQLVHDLVRANGGNDARQIRKRFLLSPFLTEVNCNIRALSAKRLIPVIVPSLLGNHFAIKTHSGPTDIARRMMGAGKLQVAYIYRDPRAAMLSALEAGQRSRAEGRQDAFSQLENFENGLAFMQGYLQIWKDWTGVPGIHILRYENFTQDYEKEAKKLALFLGADPKIDVVRKVIEKHRPEKADKGEKGKHFQFGIADRFRTSFSEKEIEKANKIFGRALSQMGYKP